MRSGMSRLWVVGLMALVICSLETGLRLGAASPDTRYTLPQFSLGYFWAWMLVHSGSGDILCRIEV